MVFCNSLICRIFGNIFSVLEATKHLTCCAPPWEITPLTMSSSTHSTLARVLTLFLAALVVFGGWALLKAKVLTPQQSAQSSTATPTPARRVLWTSNGAEFQAGGDDPRAVFSFGLTRYLGGQVSSASALSLDQIDAQILEQSDDSAELAATVQGIQYRGRLEWTHSGWQLTELSRQN